MVDPLSGILQTRLLYLPDASDPDGEQAGSDSMMQGYFDWQVTTLMLAYDLNNPVDATDPKSGEDRRRSIEDEVRSMTLDVVPDLYLNDPSLDWPADLMMTITRTTLQRAANIAGL
ncbi:MAG: hypothetical protein AAGH99_00805 [Planctomycetota bacterium]